MAPAPAQNKTASNTTKRPICRPLCDPHSGCSFSRFTSPLPQIGWQIYAVHDVQQTDASSPCVYTPWWSGCWCMLGVGNSESISWDAAPNTAQSPQVIVLFACDSRFVGRPRVCFNIPVMSLIWARFLSLARSKLRLCSANHRAGYLSKLNCDWLT